MEVRSAPRLPHVDRTRASHGWPILMAPNGFHRTFIVQDVGCECRAWPACQPRLSGYGGRAKRVTQEGAVIAKR